VATKTAKCAVTAIAKKKEIVRAIGSGQPAL